MGAIKHPIKKWQGHLIEYDNGHTKKEENDQFGYKLAKKNIGDLVVIKTEVEDAESYTDREKQKQPEEKTQEETQAKEA